MKKLLFFLVLIGLALAGVAYWLSARHRSGAEGGEYTLARVDYGRMKEVVSATGVVQPWRVFPVGTEVAGKVVGVYADFNQIVEEGDELLRLDDRMANDRVKRAELGVALARVGVKEARAAEATAAKLTQRERERSPEVRRSTDLEIVESKLESTRVAVEAARLKLEEAQEALRQAKLGLSLTRVRVPVLARAEAPAGPKAKGPGVGALAGEGFVPRKKRSFIVLDRKVSLNQQVGPPASAHLFTLAGRLDRMEVQVQVVEGDVTKITRGLRAEFTVSGGGDAEPKFHGTVDEVRLVPASERGAVYYKVILDARNQRGPSGDWLLRPGLTASVDILRRVHERVWKVPTAALNFQPDEGALTDAARAKLARWSEVPDHDLWRPVWVVGGDHKPWPVFVRTGGKSAGGQAGIQDPQFTEALEWDPEASPKPDPANPSTFPEVITGMPAPQKGGWFSAPNIKF